MADRSSWLLAKCVRQKTTTRPLSDEGRHAHLGTAGQREPGVAARRPTWVRSADTVRVPSALLITAAVLAVPAPAHASCGEAPTARPPLAVFDHVFAGSVTRTTHGGAAAEVDVTDVWHGPDLPPRVVVAGGQLSRGASSSVDRSFRAGERYAFFVTRADDGSLHDNACTPTAPLSTRAAVDPPGVRPPVASADAPTDPRSVLDRIGAPGQAALLLAGTAAAAGVAAQRARRRSGRRPASARVEAEARPAGRGDSPEEQRPRHG